MVLPQIPWAPRVLLAGRLFRLPVRAQRGELEVQVAPFAVVERRWVERDGAFYYYLRAPAESGDYALRAVQGGRVAERVVQVRTLNQLRRAHTYNGAVWPRRWPVGGEWHSTKAGQTLQDEPVAPVRDREALRWWIEAEDAEVWRQLPPAEFPRAHYVNVHQGCPACGTAIFAHHGFYPWKRRFDPGDLRSQCPSCGAVFPSNDLAGGDFSSGDFVDDGFGYFDGEGRVFLFAASYHRDLVSRFQMPVDGLTSLLRADGFDAMVARRLGLLLLRYAVEALYLAAAPQFRHGPSQEVEKAWEWGQPDWASQEDPIRALYRKGLMRYSIDVPYMGVAAAMAYDAIWPFLRQDRELVDRAQAMGVEVGSPEECVHLVEELLAALLQCCVDGGGVSNLPRVSEGVLVMLRALDRPDAGDVMEWLYDRGPDKLRVFATNDFFPDGTPPEATGGYNTIHTRGLFALEYQLRKLRARHPEAYSEALFPSLVEGGRAGRIVRAPCEIALLGKVPFHFGDGGSAGVQTPLEKTKPLAPLPAETLRRAEQYLGDEGVGALCRAVEEGEYLAPGSTVHDGVGFAILRTGEKPERAAAGIVYGDATFHRHMDLLDVQLYAFDRPFLSDLGYPQSWDSVKYWEGNWATHNSLWGVVPEERPLELPFDTPWPFLKEVAGRGRLRRLASGLGMQVVEVEAERWVWDLEAERWRRPGVSFRRLLALVETGGEGVVLVDLARVRGGSEHWRLCRGLEGEFAAADVRAERRPGTLAGAAVERGRLEAVEHPDYRGLACMDEVALLQAPSLWKGTWTSRHDGRAHLDLYQVRAPLGVEVATARATAVLGEPAASRYCYRALAWKARPRGEESSCVDLVFEPHMGEATLEGAEPIAVEEGAATASGVRLATRTGKVFALYWAPEAGAEEPTRFVDGVELWGGLAVVAEEGVMVAGASRLRTGRGSRRLSAVVQRGRIRALDRSGCSVDVEGLEEVPAGARVRLPSGRNYRVEAVEQAGAGLLRLRLDLSSVLGRARVAAFAGEDIELDFFVVTRTGYLHGTWMEREADGERAQVVRAMNPDMNRTRVGLQSPIAALQAGDWVRFVAYAAGDEVLYEPVCIL